MDIENETQEDGQEQELSLRETIEAAAKPVDDEKPEKVEVKAEKAEKVDDDVTDDKPAKKAEKEPSDDKADDDKPKADAKPKDQPEKADDKPSDGPLSPPNGWSKEAKAKWHELPEEVQQAAIKREQDVAKFTSKSDEQRQLGIEIQKTVDPYMPMIQAEGGNAVAAVQSLLNTAYLLRTGSPQQKRDLMLQTAEQFGVDLTPQEQPQGGNSELTALQSEIQQLRGMLTQQQQAEQQNFRNEVQSELQAFAADPANQHFESVRAHMGALMTAGAASSLQDAYDQACWANPEVRATIQATERAEAERKRQAEAKATANEAKRKAVSLSGGQGGSQFPPSPDDRSLRDELKANLQASMGAI